MHDLSGSSRSPKVLFVGRSVAQFRYYDSIVAALLGRDVQVKLLLDEEWSSRQSIQFESAALDAFRARHPALKVDWAIRRADRWRFVLFPAREIRSYVSYLRRGSETTSFYVDRWFQYLPAWLRRIGHWSVVELLLRWKLVEFLLRRLETLAPPAAPIVEHLQREAPDVLVASPVNQRFSEEVEYVKAAKALGIPTAIVTYSWDNLSTKGLYHVVPDRLFIWNEVHWEDALHIHGIPEERLSMCGSPFFDRWFNDRQTFEDRESLCRRMGIDPQADYIVYLGSSRNIATDEAWVVEEIHRRIRASSDERLQRTEIVIRPHPANTAIYDRLLALDGLVVYPRGGALPQTAAMQDEFHSMLHHAVATAGINTTAMIDALVAGRSCLSILLSEYDRTQRNARHFRVLMERDFLDICRNFEEFVQRLHGVVHGADPKLLERFRFARWFARPRGVGRVAGEEIAEEIIEMLQATRAGSGAASAGQGDGYERQVRERIAKARLMPGYRNYVEVRRIVLELMGQGPAGRTGPDMLAARLDHLFDASPLLVDRLREHCGSLDGASSSHCTGDNRRFEAAVAARLHALQARDAWSFLVPETPELGGFGCDVDGNLVNPGTLAVYEAMLGLQRFGLLNNHLKGKIRPIAMLGGGSGNFARAFKLRFPSTTCIIIDELPAFLVSATFLMTVFPDARFLFLDGEQTHGRSMRALDYDFVFVPLARWREAWPALVEETDVEFLASIEPSACLDDSSLQECLADFLRGRAAAAFLLLAGNSRSPRVAQLVDLLKQDPVTNNASVADSEIVPSARGVLTDYCHLILDARPAWSAEQRPAELTATS